MPDDPIPREIRDFIARYIDSVAQLEALLLLRDNPGDIWDRRRVAERLYTSEDETALFLARLCDDGLLSAADGVYRYDAHSPELAALVDRLAERYKRHLIPITNLIHAKPRRIREFADAFKLKKDE
ncbi:MAG TPA: hypothetical protein VMT54_14080 [Candidatus Cybelea sp.]|nr:hypothetical protein [Candidatus Cybelea sp.]